MIAISSLLEFTLKIELSSSLDVSEENKIFNDSS
jgi:hypothetical protein